MQEPRPRTIVYATWSFALALLIGASILGFGWGFPLQAWLSLLIIGSLIILSAHRQNWARWVLSMVTIAFLIFTWDLVRFQLTYTVIMGIATVIQFSLELLGCCLLFLPRSGRWYRQRAG